MYPNIRSTHVQGIPYNQHFTVYLPSAAHDSRILVEGSLDSACAIAIHDDDALALALLALAE